MFCLVRSLLMCRAEDDGRMRSSPFSAFVLSFCGNGYDSYGSQ